MFQVLLGDRYGSRSLPTRILKDEFEALKAAQAKRPELDFKFTESTENGPLVIDNLLDCYRCDENEKPPRYKLRHITSLIPGYKPVSGT